MFNNLRVQSNSVLLTLFSLNITKQNWNFWLIRAQDLSIDLS